MTATLTRGRVRGMTFPDLNHAKTVCRIGGGHSCCRYLTMAPMGWSCEKHSDMAALLDARAAAGDMVARGDNCEGMSAR